MADARVFDVDEHFVGAWFWDWDLFVFDWTAGLLDDLGPLLLWDLRCHVGSVGDDVCLNLVSDHIQVDCESKSVLKGNQMMMRRFIITSSRR